MTEKKRNHRFGDRGRFFTVTDLGEKRSTTPEGFLVCHDVPIARIGVQIYHKDELKDDEGDPIIDPGPDDLVRIERLPEEVFRAQTIASFEGKAVTVEHPNEFVNPSNWQQLAVGTTQNVRRGTGIQDDLLMADLVITDQAAITYVNKTLPEVSAGYEAAYEQSEPGRGFQREIVGNHVALVERGRAGPRCSIQDKEIKMTKKARSVWDRILTAVKAQDAEAIAEELKDVTDSDDEDDEKDGKKKTGDAAVLKAIDALSKQVGRLTKDMEEMKKKSEDDDEEEEEAKKKAAEEAKKKSKDSDDGDDGDETNDTIVEAETGSKKGDPLGKILSGDSLQKVGSRAELLSPGVKFKVKDKAEERSEAIVFMRSTLEKALTGDNTKGAVETMLSGRDLKKLTADSVASVFIGAAEIMRTKNNSSITKTSTVTTRDFGKTVDAATINQRNRDYWAARK